MTESTIERSVCAYAKAKGCIVLKLSGQNQRGQPDRMFVREGRVLFVEFKAPGKRPTALQERWIDDLRRQGMLATSCDDIEKGKVLINFFLL
jgi:Holliday junction resolvase